MSTTTTSPETTTLPVIAEHIVATPGTCGGKPRIAGTRIKVQHVAFWHEKMGMTPAQIVAEYPHLSLAGVHSALAYYYDHRAEIEKDVREGEEFVEKLRAGQPSILDKIRDRHAQNNSSSP